MTKHITRKTFLKTGLAASSALFMFPFDLEKKNNQLCFSTLGCPGWSFDNILDFAAAYGFGGIEIRGIQREIDLSKSPVFNSSEQVHIALEKVKKKKLKIANLGSSSVLHYDEGEEKQKSFDEAKTYIRLANQLNCPYIRVFPNLFPPERDKNKTIEIIANNLLELGKYASNYGVTVLMETHGDVVKTADIVSIMERASHPNTGLIWDIVNMWSATKESPAEVYPQLKKYIHHTHIKDIKFIEGKGRYVFVGKGESPILEAVELLKKDYKGYYSLEWEKLWHPELEEPALAFADYAKTMKQILSK